ncbi:MAG: SagB family peptide dehydrogenase [Campylobacterota bacterium]|nr:SagB family peptide dehydrogenase [Campylobacterota bacterium]
MPNFHNQTNHTYMSIRKNAFFLDWRTQAKNYKKYPHFFQRFKIEDYPQLEDLNLIGGITFEKEYPDGKYYLRTVPSAGGLYPFEVYLQIRGIKGLLDGIYHYEPYEASLVLLNEISNDGVEFYQKDNKKQKGITFLISGVYFRSSWKYRDRAIRYILLDGGHQLASIYTVLFLMGKNSEISFDFDKLALNEMFGFRDDEMFLTMIKSIDETIDKDVTKLKQPIPYICPSDYLETNQFIEESYKTSAVFEDENISMDSFFTNIPKEQLKNAILNRRSIRAFRKVPISNDEFDFIVKDIFSFALQNDIDIYYTVHNVNNMTQGLYKNETLLKDGDFSSKSKYLSLEQNIGGQSCVTFYFTSSQIEKYQKVNILSGFIAHIIYIKSQLQDIGCSGIGAYYDDEVKEFLETSNNILYLLAIGR